MASAAARASPRTTSVAGRAQGPLRFARRAKDSAAMSASSSVCAAAWQRLLVLGATAGCVATARDYPSSRAIRWRPDSETASRGVLRHSLRSSPRAPRARPTRLGCRLEKSDPDRCRLHSCDSPCSRGVAVPRGFQNLAKVFLRLEKRVLRGRFRDFQHLGNLGVAKPLHFVEQKNIALMARQLGQGALQRQAEGWVRAWGSRLGSWGRILAFIVRRDFFLAQPAAARVVTSVHQDAKGPCDKTRLASKTADASLYLEKRLLHRIFGIGGAAQYVARQILHPCAVQCIETFVGAQITRLARRRQREVFRSHNVRRWVRSGHLFPERFHSPLPLRYGRDSSLPGQRKSHHSHGLLLWNRRQRVARCQGRRPRERASESVCGL